VYPQREIFIVGIKMAKRTSPRLNINLSSAGKATVGKVVYGWTIDAGRAIIVGIELIALAALGYRFVIDRQIVDLHDQIKVQEAYIAAQAEDEKTFRSIHERLKNIKTINEQTQAKILIMNEILRAFATGTFFGANLSINEQSIILDGSTFSIYTLTDFMNGLKSYPSVSSISIDEINTADEGVRFKARVQIKDTQPRDQST
jgi:hypothetical protein